MKKDPDILLGHIKESVADIEEYSKDTAYEDFWNSRLKQDGVIRRLEIIGEAAKNIPEDFKAAHPEINWDDIMGLRDVIVHQYFGLDLKLIWKIVQQDIPDLKKKLENIK